MSRSMIQHAKKPRTRRGTEFRMGCSQHYWPIGS